ncbi:MAG: MBL fold metallo-hydrolase, partial [Alphaproteobacteria bacterium]
MDRPEIAAFFDATTNTISYVVRDPGSRACAIVDPVMDFDQAAGRIAFVGAEAIAAHVRAHDLEVHWIVETHVHADHLSAARYLRERLGGRIAIGERIVAVQETFGRIFAEGPAFRRDGSQFDRLLADGDAYMIGGMRAVALHTPGHTPACMTHVVGDAAFVGDTLFMPDGGSARADFPGGDARTLYRSMRRILDLPPSTRLFMCHDYAPGGREIRWQSSVAHVDVARALLRDAALP